MIYIQVTLMSLSLVAKRTVATCSRLAALPAQRRRPFSTHHHQEDHDTTAYPQEGFGSPFWRNIVLFSLLGVAGYKYLPERAEDVYLTRWIAMYTSPSEHWLDVNTKHTAQQLEVSKEGVLMRDAKKLPVHRYRYPQALDQSSPFLNAVGMGVDVKGVVAKV